MFHEGDLDFNVTGILATTKGRILTVKEVWNEIRYGWVCSMTVTF
jgi:hypothetical protein